MFDEESSSAILRWLFATGPHHKVATAQSMSYAFIVNVPVTDSSIGNHARKTDAIADLHECTLRRAHEFYTPKKKKKGRTLKEHRVQLQLYS